MRRFLAQPINPFMRMSALMFFVLIIIQSINAQKRYTLDVEVPAPVFRSDHLKLGGTNPKGEMLSVNNYFLSFSGKPVIPVTGEFHFSRYPQAYWDESIKKMKAGGVTVIPTYVFWNLHEEEEGRFDWSGDKNLRAFIELCKTNGMYAVVRIGPFCHGEIRSGGLPDWLLGKPLNIRMNDPLYLSYVQKLYSQIGQQLKGLYYKDGGPIIGIQIENEYQHSAAPWALTYPGQPYDLTSSERDRTVTHEGVAVSKENNPYAELGNDHMRVLKSIAVKEGIVAPLYTATGWGNAAIINNESIPVTAAYAYPFWTPKRDHSPFFLYKNMHKHPDYAPVRYQPEDYPAFPAELGSGISLVYTRRPVAVHQSFDAMINRCLGSGANGVGYYMFHGGSTPRGKHGFMNDEAYGLTKISYEYQGPIGEFGQVREGYHRLKLIHFFLKDFGHLLAPMTVVLPSNAATLKSTNTKDLRYAARVKGPSGFLFLNNFQDDTAMLDQKDIRFTMKTGKGDLLIPQKGGFNLESGENAILPYNFDLNGTRLNYATAQLLMKGGGAHPYHVFFTPKGIAAEFSFEPGVKVQPVHGTTVTKDAGQVFVKCTGAVSEFVISQNGRDTRILVVDKNLALQSYVVTLNGQKSILFSEAVVLPTEKGFDLLSRNNHNFDIQVYPKTGATPKLSSGTITRKEGIPVFSSYRVALTPFEYKVKMKEISERKMTVSLPQNLPAGVNDICLNIEYMGDTGMGFLNGELVADHFYNGLPWQIGLRKFIQSREKPGHMVLYFRPMEKNASYLLDLQAFPEYIPDFGNKSSYLKVNHISCIPEYKTTLSF